MKYRKLAMIGQDWAFGTRAAARFQRTFEEAGGQVVQKLWPPFGTTDFRALHHRAQARRGRDLLRRRRNDALRFVRQYSDAGSRGAFP